jgi:hypothetical protein
MFTELGGAIKAFGAATEGEVERDLQIQEES